LTNALVLVGQHAVYCTSQRNPAVPAMTCASSTGTGARKKNWCSLDGRIALARTRKGDEIEKRIETGN